jgi:acylphosphatase
MLGPLPVRPESLSAGAGHPKTAAAYRRYAMTELPRDLPDLPDALPQVEPQDAAPPPQHGMTSEHTDSAEPIARVTAWVRGRVQGVGFRWWTRARALELGLVGSATNLEDGRVEVVAEGPRAACEQLLARLRGPNAPGRVTGVNERWSTPRADLNGFTER